MKSRTIQSMWSGGNWRAYALLSIALLACSTREDSSISAPLTPPPAKSPPPIVVIEGSIPPADQIPGLESVGEPVKQAADFPKERWVRTVLFDQKTPYIGFTYVDRTKGNSIKGENIARLSPAEIKARLHADFPSSTMQPIPEGHPMTLLTPEEIKEYDLPPAPDWLSFYK